MQTLKQGHNMDKYNRLHGFPLGFTFTKSKSPHIAVKHATGEVVQQQENHEVIPAEQIGITQAQRDLLNLLKKHNLIEVEQNANNLEIKYEDQEKSISNP